MPHERASRREFLLRSAWSCAAAGTLPAVARAARLADQASFRLPVRSLVAGEGASEAAVKNETRELVAGQTAILICDMWNQHWCASATKRCGQLAEKMSPIVNAARARGVTIVHAPSDTLDFYKDYPGRKRAQAVKILAESAPLSSWCSLEKDREGKLPIDDSDGGCDCQPQCKNYKAWSRQHPAIDIAEVDLISDNGREVYSYFVERGIKNVLYVGVHTNMCVLGRSFGIRQMTKIGLNAVLVRDLTDTMYNPRKAPFVPHEKGTDLVVQHIERHWCPTTDSAALSAGLAG